MSARASAYMKSLTVCPNGEWISPREKLVGMVLADSHQDRAGRFTYPAVETIAEESMCDKRSCQRYLAALERKGVIRRLRPANQGRSMRVFYFFVELDELPEGWQDATLFDAPFFAPKGGKRMAERAAKGRQNVPGANSTRAQEPEPQPEQKQIQHPLTPSCNEGGSDSQETTDAGKTQTSTMGMEGNTVSSGKDSELGDGRNHPQHHTAEDRETVLQLRNAHACDEKSTCPDSAGKEPRRNYGQAAHPAVLKLPSPGADGQAAAIDRATDQVGNALSLGKRKRRMVREQIAMAADKGDEPPTIALDIIAAVHSQDCEYAAGRLKFTYGLHKFLGEGIWRNRNRWPWDIEAMRLQAAARVGSR